MNVKSIVVEQLDWNATSKSLTLEPDHNGQLWVAFPTDYDEPRNSPFYFQHPNYDKKFNEGFAECQARRITTNNFYELDGVFTYKATWQNITTERNSISYYALYLPEFAVPVDIKLLAPFSEGRQYKRTVFKDEQQPRYIIYLQCTSRFGSFSFDIICKFKIDKEGFSDSSYTDEFQQDFYARPEEWKYFLNQTEREKVEQYFITTMGDQYHINQAGAVGPNSSANNNVFNQTNYTLPDNTNYELLSSELAKLKQELISKATLPEHYIAISEVANAEEATKNKDGNKVVKSLLTAGKWVLDAATDIGTSVVAEIITKQIGG
ncbi:hypothetical protein GCM10027594_09140 [Hymenobacter agri]